jgi:hypothetical protein
MPQAIGPEPFHVFRSPNEPAVEANHCARARAAFASELTLDSLTQEVMN